jgi:predicted Zn-dependent protease
MSVSIPALAAAVGLALTLVPVQEEIAIGREARRQVARATPIVQDPEVIGYVRAIGRRLAARSGGPDYPFSFDVANYREVNAFALPGGPVWIHRGAIAAAATEAQLAGVLAHEVAHIARRHAAGQLTRTIVAQWGLGFFGALLGNAGGGSTAQTVAQAAAGTAFLRFSRDDELDADRAGALIMHRAGWDARGLLEFMQGIERQARRRPSSVEVFFSTHPAPADRTARLRDIVPRFRGGTRDSAAFQRIRARLARMPAAAQMPRPR